MSHILVVDDEDSIRLTVINTLIADGYQISECRNGKEAITCLSEDRFDLVILDIVMPEMDGYEVCNWMMSHNLATPVLMLSSKDTDIDKAIGLNLGADDYLTKPFSPIELKARVKARLRKKEPERPDAFICLGNAKLDKDQQRFWIGEKEVSLSATEFELIYLFLSQPRRVFTRDILLDHLRGQDYPAQLHAIDNHIYRLRLKLKEVPDSDITIQTVINAGYRLNILKN